MKTHIFIATTQGLVAIQNITPIDDEDISSVVSVNGTSTTANISSSYHNFVKKGVGIIQQMFGACSYRVDISARIDQGNSWQVAMYLAHLAQSKGLLGNGEVKQGDKVICATGEVNTSNLQVLAVSEVALKFKLAQPQLQHWKASGAEVQFLLPQANQSDLQHNSFTLIVNNLEQAATALPSSSPQHSAANIKHNKLASVNFRYIIAITATILALLMFFGVREFTSTTNTQQQTVTTKDVISQEDPSKTIQLLAQLKQDKSCAQTAIKNVYLSNQTFSELALSQLCKLHLKIPKSQLQVLLIAQDAYTVLPLIRSPQGWQIPLPKNRLSNRHYYLVTLSQTLNEEKVERLRIYREAMSKPDMLSESALTQWLQTQDVDFVIYTHKLVVK
ncbi:hypothetical protein [uncultured Paraglaciecola sp.]|uniref:hypothetical protein n=1 Tax=uncultured Paraglaciecola sp. TaxID=1765024 RepID=UPI0030D82FDA|tara:strand:- start:62572 stop:63738 length:1167 start_codon:yes stop_codon:yes gene_type:complete